MALCGLAFVRDTVHILNVGNSQDNNSTLENLIDESIENIAEPTDKLHFTTCSLLSYSNENPMEYRTIKFLLIQTIFFGLKKKQ